jgi:hypothetical protein
MMSLQNIIAAFALAISLGSLALSWAAFKAQRRRTNMELARSLHFDLTSGEVAQARESLGTLTRDSRSLRFDDPEQRMAWLVDARTDYFTLLWCFERIWAGRVTLIADEGHRGAGRARGYLEDLIRWHVRNWAMDLPVIKQVLADELNSSMQDQDSSKAFGRLSEVLLKPEEKAQLLGILSDRGLEPTGYEEWQK